jgi:hypothetical protein
VRETIVPKQIPVVGVGGQEESENNPRNHNSPGVRSVLAIPEISPYLNSYSADDAEYGEADRDAAVLDDFLNGSPRGRRRPGPRRVASAGQSGLMPNQDSI